MTKGLKVYYLPIHTFYNQCILPTMMCNIPLLRYILIRERIEIVHGHSAFSALAHEAMFVGKLLGLKVSENLENHFSYSRALESTAGRLHRSQPFRVRRFVGGRHK